MFIFKEFACIEFAGSNQQHSVIFVFDQNCKIVETQTSLAAGAKRRVLAGKVGEAYFRFIYLEVNETKFSFTFYYLLLPF